MSKFTELTRVQMPAMMHLTKLGYKYYGKITQDMKGQKYDGDTNILLDIFKKKFVELCIILCYNFGCKRPMEGGEKKWHKYKYP